MIAVAIKRITRQANSRNPRSIFVIGCGGDPPTLVTNRAEVKNEYL